MDDTESVKESLRLLREKYARELPEKISRIEKAADYLLGGRLGKDDFDGLARMVHTLSGSASSFGYTALGSAAKMLEHLLKNIGRDDTDISGETRDKCRLYLDEMKRESLDLAGVSTDELSFNKSSSFVTVQSEEGKLLYLCDDDEFLIENLSLQISHFGYEVKGFNRASELRSAVRKAVPSAIVMDITFPEGEMEGIDSVREIKKGCPHVPVVFMSNRNDLNTRIRAVQSGGNAYVLKPLNVAGLIDMLDALTKDAHTSAPYRVLIIDDDPDLASYYSMVLKQASIDARVVTDPFGVMAHLIEFNPDLILMDMYMPGCDGFELSKVIRQIESFVSIPIVFLSSETDIEKQLTAMSMGGDDFLTKPIEPEHLVSSVRSRAERMRIIRSFMDRDSLTGLLNHTKTKEHLDIMTERASRQNVPLAFAMIDIDRFKSVNDTYGHPTGDRVISSISRLLQQRLRKTDVIGRYGGEEFAVIFADTDIQHARRILDEIRESFAKVRHHSDKGEFSVTFSCGIASFPHFGNAKAVTIAADNALYEAKRSGRNKVVSASEGGTVNL
ncbi:MAG: diguanylate cyclase [Thermodesulfovibrionales bacterium]|nr:diguanylate cyclase [Thermodesulfovibrionales bacterium]